MSREDYLNKQIKRLEKLITKKGIKEKEPILLITNKERGMIIGEGTEISPNAYMKNCFCLKKKVKAQGSDTGQEP